MEFVGNGRFLLARAGAEDAAAYTALHLACLETAYADIIGPDFGPRIRRDAQEVAEEDALSLARPDAVAFMVWMMPAAEDDGAAAGDDGAGRHHPAGRRGDASSQYDAAAPPPPDPNLFTRPVGLALALDGPQDWEQREAGATPLEGVAGQAPRDLVNLYLLPEVQGLGLGRHLMEAVLPPGSPAYLWIINGNHRAETFYRRQGFGSLREAYAAGGPWAPATTGRMVRGLSGPASSSPS